MIPAMILIGTWFTPSENLMVFCLCAKERPLVEKTIKKGNKTLLIYTVKCGAA